MKPALFTLFLGLQHPLFKTIAFASARRIPAIQYPVCRRNLTCTAHFQDFQTIMGDISIEQKGEAERLAQPAANEAQILKNNKVRKEALKEVKEESKPALPKLSAAEFKLYNSLADHMQYFVRLPTQHCKSGELTSTA